MGNTRILYFVQEICAYRVGSDLVINVGGRSIVQRTMLVTHGISYSPQHTVLRSRGFDIVLVAHAQKRCILHIRT